MGGGYYVYFHRRYRLWLPRLQDWSFCRQSIRHSCSELQWLYWVLCRLPQLRNQDQDFCEPDSGTHEALHQHSEQGHHDLPRLMGKALSYWMALFFSKYSSYVMSLSNFFSGPSSIILFATVWVSWWSCDVNIKFPL